MDPSELILNDVAKRSAVQHLDKTIHTEQKQDEKSNQYSQVNDIVSCRSFQFRFLGRGENGRGRKKKKEQRKKGQNTFSFGRFVRESRRLL